MPTIIEVDPFDDRLLRAFWATEQAAHRAGREAPVLRTYGALASLLRDPSPYGRHLLLAVVEGERVLAGADLSYPLQHNLHLAGLEVAVHPDHRRRGLGTALHAAALERLRVLGRTTVVGEVYEPLDGSSPAMTFALAHGYVSALVEQHLVLPLPAAVDLPAPADDYHVVTWTDRCPDEHLTAYCAMNTQMAADVPTGDLDLEPLVWDEQRVRTSEARTAASYRRLVAAAVTAAGEMVGYSELFLPHGEDYAQQDDTLVMPDHRGHRLGLRLKGSNLAILRERHPERRVLHTWTAPDNVAMMRTNEQVGFRAVERMHEMQRTLE